MLQKSPGGNDVFSRSFVVKNFAGIHKYRFYFPGENGLARYYWRAQSESRSVCVYRSNENRSSEKRPRTVYRRRRMCPVARIVVRPNAVQFFFPDKSDRSKSSGQRLTPVWFPVPRVSLAFTPRT